MKECPLRLDTPAPILADWLNEHGWSYDDLQRWFDAVVLAYLSAGGWHTVPAGLVLEQWELVLPGERQEGR